MALTDAQAPARVTARLITDKTPLIAGSTAEIGIHLTIEPGWHVYWDGQNDTGLPVTYAARFPEGFQPGPIRWPGPMRHLSDGGILDHIYEREVTLIVPVKVPATASGEVTLALDLTWLVCKNVCLPEEASAELQIPVAAAGTAQTATKEAPLLDRARARLPRPLPADSSAASARWEGETLLLTGRPGSRIEFYPGPSSATVQDLIETGVGTNGRLLLRFDGTPAKASGVLAVWPAADSAPEYYQVDLDGPGSAGPASDRK